MSILVTGGCGSLGKKLVTELWRLGYEEIKVFSRNEAQQWKFKQELNNKSVEFCLGDVRVKEDLRKYMKGVSCVIHTAALKHVPNCEEFPNLATQINVLGTKNVLEEAICAGVRKFVYVSTDKAVYPINTLGLTKALGEKLTLRYMNSGMRVNIVRYGNVICSQGSILPLWIKQAKEGKSLFVTNLSMTRFLMRLEDAKDIIFFVLDSEEVKDGDIVIPKLNGTTVENLLNVIQKRFNTNNIVMIGERAGEKQHETLITNEELLTCRVSEDKKYFIIGEENKKKIGRNKKYLCSGTTTLLKGKKLENYLMTCYEFVKELCK